ncbi:GNAT family N-acetyltransferase [Flavobacteriaceae sp. LMIT009]
MKDINYKRAQTTEELNQILALQHINIPSAISKGEREREGFVTVHHTFAILSEMNAKCPHVIATSNENVIAYSLCMLRSFREDIEILRPMFKQIDDCLKRETKYIVMGQICVDKEFRKQGVFRGMYNFMKRQLKSQYDMIITEVDKKNIRSMNAHYAVGFRLLNSYYSKGQNWNLIYLEI